MNEQVFQERECIHRVSGVDGEYYRGDVYIRHLMQLRSAVALNFAGKVTSFFWADAPHVAVWLCRDCASELGINVGEESLVS